MCQCSTKLDIIHSSRPSLQQILTTVINYKMYVFTVNICLHTYYVFIMTSNTRNGTRLITICKIIELKCPQTIFINIDKIIVFYYN